jgi:hypothetical protein
VLRGAAVAASAGWLERATASLMGVSAAPLEEFGYEQVRVTGKLQTAQRENVSEVLMGLDIDSLLMPFRAMAGQSAPGVSLGGWYGWKADYDHHHDDAGLAPGATLGQWSSALARLYAGSTFAGAPGTIEMRDRALRLNALLGEAISTQYFTQTRFAGYSFDKLVCGLMDGHRLAGDKSAFGTLDKVAAAAAPVLPGHAVDRDVQWKVGSDGSWMWDETYTLPENLYLISRMGAGQRYRRMAEAYLDDATYFEPLSRGVNVMADKHGYSYVNALCSAMQAYFVSGSEMHLKAATNGFAMLEAQSFATGGWAPEELLRKPGYDDLAKAIVTGHNGFETPCGGYAHMKLTRYLLRATRDGHYGDSMERVMLNTVLGSLPLQADGRSFYYSDYNVVGKRIYSVHRWPCCSGTLPQVVADYGINTYLREPGAVWVNLYQPSELRWREGAADVRIEQVGIYPEEDRVRLRVTAMRAVGFALRLRIPAWAGERASLTVNGKPVAMKVEKGFASVERVWRGGELVELNLPMVLRLEGLPANGGPVHPDAVALMWGPLVLFALREPGEVGTVNLGQEALLKAERTGPLSWNLNAGADRRMFVPFTEVGEREYSTYIRLV